MRPLLFAAALALLPAAASAAEITVFAAASLKTALDRIAADWQAQTGHSAVISYDGSSKLAKQIQSGAPADLFLSAAENWMDVLEADKLLVEGSRRDLLGNTLVLIGHGPSTPITLDARTDLKGLLGGGKLAMALVESVPAGQYGKEALTTLGLWDSVAADVAQADNVRAALKLVALDEAPFGIVYASDAVAEPTVSVAATFPASSHTPITYPAALIAPARPEAQAFLDFLSTQAAVTVFEGQGFTVMK
ncbi:molybdate transport system substrate-binding protein [Gemmobacter aquatilis]|uniref:Molybdate transport system substrate-binding protein n=1 Tax=Gemmobacter aquatilis TaxID=933059 RepID=A0A1H8BQ68_9RHOB|nr:molybdate ABC transporter substrate-binding protein [Gemmobacter aquatilis]SEM84679.1 molybdate transport system substrate-binding protein [Gemmobacter aquatilis]